MQKLIILNTASKKFLFLYSFSTAYCKLFLVYSKILHSITANAFQGFSSLMVLAGSAGPYSQGGNYGG